MFQFRFVRAAWAFAPMLWCHHGFAADTKYVFPFNTFTAAELVKKLTTEAASATDARESDRAHFYLAGIKDGTEGFLWCFKGAMLPHELNYEIAHALKERHTATELDVNAAPLVIEELKRRYPCRGTAGNAR